MPARAVFALLLIVLSPAVVVAQFSEVEPNETKALATPVVGITNGGTITGTTTGSGTTAGAATSNDTFLIQTAAAALGIYHHRLVITTAGTAGHTGTLRGLSQSGGIIAPASDATIQTSSTGTTPSRFNQWYGFGKGEQVYYRVTGGTTTTAPYVATLTTTPITPVDAGNAAAGPITLSAVGVAGVDTDLWVYDAAFNALADFGNDDEPSPGSTPSSRLVRTFAPGVYYIAISNFNLANDQASPLDERFRSGNVLDFPNAVGASSTGINLNLGFTITDSACGTRLIPLTKTEAFQVRWVKLTVLSPTNAATAFETNDAEADLNIDGVQNNGTAPIDVSRCVGTFARVNLCSTLAGNPWDLCITLNPAVAAPTICGGGTGGLASPNGQSINLDLADPSLTCWFGLQFTNAFPATSSCGEFRIPLISLVPIANITGQMVVVNPAHPDFVELSAPVQIHYAVSGIIPGPVGDDATVAVQLGFVEPGCLPGPFSFYGNPKTRLFVSTNGRVTFDAADAAFNPSVTAALAGPPQAGLWADLDVGGGGAITISASSPTTVRVDYLGVPYFGSTVFNTYAIEFDTAASTVALRGLGAVGSFAANQFVGLSPGAAGSATDPGATFFTPAGGGGSPNATDMIYAFGAAGSGVVGLGSIVFSPNPLGGYDWASN